MEICSHCFFTLPANFFMRDANLIHERLIFDPSGISWVGSGIDSK